MNFRHLISPRVLSTLRHRCSTAVRLQSPAHQVQYNKEQSPMIQSHRLEALRSNLHRLATNMRIAVIYGGDSSQEGSVIHRTANPRGWKSYQGVAEDIAEALTSLGFRYVTTVPEDMNLGGHLRDNAVDMAWLNTAGVQGFGSVGHAASQLEMLGIPYVGHNPINAVALDNKHLFKQRLAYAGIPTSPFLICHHEMNGTRLCSTERFAKTFGEFEGPFVVKPVSGRASLNVSFVERAKELDDAVMEGSAKTGNLMMIEAFLPGREYCVAISGHVVARKRMLERLEKPFVFSAVERVLDSGENIFTSMDNRVITVDRVRPLNPHKDRYELGQLEMLARRVHDEFNLETLVRLDVRADAAGRLFVLEANPKPDLARGGGGRTSLIARGLAASGMDYNDLILSLIADRLDVLSDSRRETVAHLDHLLQSSNVTQAV